MMYVQKLSNHVALMIPRALPLDCCLTSGNEDPPDKKAKDQYILETALPEQAHFLCTREPMLNYADAELCGKWKVGSICLRTDTRSSKNYCNTGSVREVKF
jgi:DNA excision repair protein ERCC-6-like 2